MPQTDGIETIRAIRQIQPEARIIVISGGYFGSGWNYLDSVVVLGANLALQKPFTCSQLLSAIDRLLGARATARVRHTRSAAAC